MNYYDVIVVGGGFAGVSAAMQIARARRKVLIIDEAKPRNRFAIAAHGLYGLDGKTIPQLREIAQMQLANYPSLQWINAGAIDATKEDKNFTVKDSNGKTYQSKRLILATGVKDILPDIPGIAEKWGKTVLHCPYCHGYEVREKRLGIIATSEASLHQAMILPDWGDDIVLFTNNVIGKENKLISELRHKNIRIITTPIAELLGKGSNLDAIRLTDNSLVERDAVFAISQVKQASNLPYILGCPMEDGAFGAYIKTDNFKATPIQGLYAAGDAARSMHNATWAISDGVTAGIFTHQSLLKPQNRS
ncbi:MAG: NAD(P)/FAD-dependent oxidoreductase [Rivularia sp. (in: cyanobacteria)]